MPIVPVKRDELFEALGATFTDEEFDELCFEFGVELDDITSEKEMARREQGEAAAEGKSDAVLYKIDVPANRYDILCLEGLARALKVFRGTISQPVYTVSNPDDMVTITVAPSTGAIRPYVVGAVLRNISFNKQRYNSFLDLQDQLHRNICRRRTLVSMGTHDLDNIEGPFRYEALPPEDINFVPLAQTQSFNARELLEFYETDASVKHIKPYVPIIKDSPVYPVILDSRRRVMSLPPIINGELSKMSEGTRNIFIEITATDHTKAKIVLNQLVTCFAEYCETPFSVEPVKVIYESDAAATEVTPDLSDRVATADVDDICSVVGVPLEPGRICHLLTKMQLASTYDYESNKVTVQVPPSRPDILHQCDIIEDVAIAFGYNNIPRTLPQGATVGRQQPMNRLTDLVRVELANAGFTECLNMALVGRLENFDYLRRKDDGTSAVVLKNPMAKEFQIVRTSLYAGLCKTLNQQKSVGSRGGIRIFEVSDVCVLDDTTDVGARNERMMAAMYSGPTAGFEIIHGLLDRILQKLDVVSVAAIKEEAIVAERHAASASAGAAAGAGTGAGAGCDGGDEDEEEDVMSATARAKELPRYILRSVEDPTYFARRSAEVILLQPHESDDAPGLRVGTLGVLHPEVLGNFKIENPVSALEVSLEPFL